VYLTIEVRWFDRGITPPAILSRFSKIHPKVWAEPEHTDYYYSLLNDDTIGIKLRENRIEIKKRRAVSKLIRFTSQAAGVLETWEKWSIALHPVEINFNEIADGTIWFGIRKQRNLQRYQLTESLIPIPVAYHRRVPPGFTLELSQITIKQENWWTMAFEFYETANNPITEIQNIIKEIVSSLPNLRLDSQLSFGYPQFLNRNITNL
jgi:hypothetical protein